MLSTFSKMYILDISIAFQAFLSVNLTNKQRSHMRSGDCDSLLIKLRSCRNLKHHAGYCLRF